MHYKQPPTSFTWNHPPINLANGWLSFKSTNPCFCVSYSFKNLIKLLSMLCVYTSFVITYCHGFLMTLATFISLDWDTSFLPGRYVASCITKVNCNKINLNLCLQFTLSHQVSSSSLWMQPWTRHCFSCLLNLSHSFFISPPCPPKSGTASSIASLSQVPLQFTNHPFLTCMIGLSSSIFLLFNSTVVNCPIPEILP